MTYFRCAVVKDKSRRKLKTTEGPVSAVMYTSVQGWRLFWDITVSVVKRVTEHTTRSQHGTHFKANFLPRRARKWLFKHIHIFHKHLFNALFTWRPFIHGSFVNEWMHYGVLINTAIQVLLMKSTMNFNKLKWSAQWDRLLQMSCIWRVSLVTQDFLRLEN